MADPLKTAARRAYERGRLRAAVPWGAPPLVIAALSGVPVAFLGVGVAVAVIAMRWRGEGLGRAVLPGLLGGALAWSGPFAWELFAPACAGAACAPSCVSMCVGAGAAGGVLLARLVGDGTEEWAAALVVASTLAAMGCLPVGVAGLAGVVAMSAVGVPLRLARGVG